MQRNLKWVLHPNLNYTDRRVYKLNDNEIEQYTLWEEENKTFIVGDMLSAQVTTTSPISIFNSFPNYVLVYKGTQLEARYFVTLFSAFRGDTQEEDSAQFTVSLIRDVLVDFADKYKDKTFKCSRGYLDDTEWSPLLVQPEGISPNQIKVKQTNFRMWDGDTNWLTIFYDSKKREKPIQLSFSADAQSQYTMIEFNNDISSLGLNVQNNRVVYKRDKAALYFENRYQDKNQQFNAVLTNGKYDVDTMSASGTYGYYLQSYRENFEVSNLNTISRDFVSLSNTIKTLQYFDVNIESILSKYNKTVIDNQLLYIEVIESEEEYYQPMYDTVDHCMYLTSLGAKFGASNVASIIGEYRNLGTTLTKTTLKVYMLKLNFVDVKDIVITLDLPSEETLTESNVGCVSIPYGADVVLLENNNRFVLDPKTLMSLATSGYTSAGSSIYDIQLLPYCPVDYLNSKNQNRVPSSEINIDSYAMTRTVPLKSGNDTIFYGFIVNESSGSYCQNFNITPENLKMDSITKMYRLVSHNHQQAYEFNPVNNNGIQYFFVEYTIKPINTIFRICPVFNENSLNGGNYRDVRGLVWSGGFSMSQVKDQWVEYQLQNSTYQEMFDRSIEYEGFTNSMANLQAWLGFGTSMLGATTSGLGLGSKYSNNKYQNDYDLWNANNKMDTSSKGLYSSISEYYFENPEEMMSPHHKRLLNRNPLSSLGGITGLGFAGMAMNAVGSLSSAIIGTVMRNKALDYKKDQFALQNKAIQARPNTFASGTEYSILNAKKAYIEEYDCTPTEKSLIQYYLDMNSYTVNSLGLIQQFLRPDSMTMIQGSYWFFDDIPAQVGNYINEQLSTGVYIMDASIYAIQPMPETNTEDGIMALDNTQRRLI